MARTQTGSRKKAAPPPPQTDEMETREQKFKRLGQARVTRAINSVRLVGNLGSPNYAATDADKMMILSALEEAVDSVRQKLLRPKGKHVLSFSWQDKQEEATH